MLSICINQDNVFLDYDYGFEGEPDITSLMFPLQDVDDFIERLQDAVAEYRARGN